MCTASWQWSESSCLLWFSRDERRERTKAKPPRLYNAEESSSSASRFLAPQDPQGGGTWIWLNCHGLAACLLNDYSAQASPQSENLQSRGQLMQQLASSHSSEDFEENLLQSWEIEAYRGCHLLLFSLRQPPRYWHCQAGKRPQPRQLSALGMRTSSSWQEAQVCAARQQRFEKLITRNRQELQESDFERFHRDGDPLGASWSVLMDRELSTTHSLTQLNLQENQATMRYQDRQALLEKFDPQAASQRAEFAPAVYCSLELSTAVS